MSITSTVETRSDDKYSKELIRHWAPVDSPKAGIVIVHGIAEHSGRYERVGGLLAEAGFEVAAPDLYGFGETGGPRADVEEWTDYLDQVQRLVEQFSPSVIIGHSMGGLIAVDYLTSERPQPDLAVLSAPAIGGGAAWQKAVAGVAAKLFPNVTVPNGVKGEELSRDPDVAEAYFADPLVVTSTTTRLGNFMFEAQRTVKGDLAAWSVETLVLHGGSDSIVPPQSTVGLGGLERVERRLYPGLRHELFNEPEGPELVSEIVDWLRERL